MWREASSRLDRVETDKMNVYILMVMSILRQRYCSPKYLYFLLPGQEKAIRDPMEPRRKEILIKDAGEFEKLWNTSVAHLKTPSKSSCIRRNTERTPNTCRTFLSCRHSRRSAPTPKHCQPIARIDANRKLRHWYWAAVFTNRYSGSVESTSARDFIDVKDWFEDDEAAPAVDRRICQHL